MSEVKIDVRKRPAEFEPGEEIVGAAQWLLARTPEAVEARLLWYTGRGPYVADVIETVRFEGALKDDTRPFRFTAPEAPYSYCGRLLTLCWAVELMAYPNRESARVELVIAPGGRALEFPPMAE